MWRRCLVLDGKRDPSSLRSVGMTTKDKGARIGHTAEVVKNEAISPLTFRELVTGEVLYGGAIEIVQKDGEGFFEEFGVALQDHQGDRFLHSA